MQQRPVPVTVFGILNIGFAVFSLILLPISLIMMSKMADNPLLKQIYGNPAYAAWMKVMTFLGLISAGFQLAAGIGLLFLKNWARITSIVYAIYTIVTCILSGMMMVFYVARPLLEEAQGPQKAAAIGGAFSGVFGSCFGVIYPILLLIFMTRPKIVAAFRPGTPPIPPAFPQA